MFITYATACSHMITSHPHKVVTIIGPTFQMIKPRLRETKRP
jgi:hypothetical protein